MTVTTPRLISVGIGIVIGNLLAKSLVGTDLGMTLGIILAQWGALFSLWAALKLIDEWL